MTVEVEASKINWLVRNFIDFQINFQGLKENPPAL